MPTIEEIYRWLDGLAPFSTAEDFDNAGLLLGDRSREVKKVFFALDAISQTVEEAIRFGTDLMITHHPLIFRPLRRIDYTTPLGQALCRMVSAGMGLIAAHTNWDRAPGGVSDALANSLDLTEVQEIDPFIRLGKLPSPMTASALRSYIAERLQMEPLLFSASDAPISSLAVSGGAYGEGAVIAHRHGADAFLVGEIGYHELLDVHGLGITVLQGGHFATERPGIAALYERFLKDAAAASWQTEARLFTPAPFAGTPV